MNTDSRREAEVKQKTFFPQTVRPALASLKNQDEWKLPSRASKMKIIEYIIVSKEKLLFFQGEFSVLLALKYWKKIKNWNAWLVHTDIWEYNVQVLSNQHLAEDCHWTYSKVLDFLSQKQRPRGSWNHHRHMTMIAEGSGCCQPVIGIRYISQQNW